MKAQTPVHVRDCPFCSRKVVFVDSTKTIHHEDPPCAGFPIAMQLLGLVAGKSSERLIVVADSETNEGVIAEFPRNSSS